MDLKKMLQLVGGDLDQLKEQYATLAGTLSRFGLTEYESRAYVALVALGPSSANFVAEVSQIPRTSAYKVMVSLAEKGYVSELPGRPRTFSPVDPAELQKRFVVDVEQAFAKLSAVKDILSDRGIPQLVYTIMGKDRVLDKIGEMADKSVRIFVMSSPSLSQIRARLGKKISAAVSRGVEVTIITSPFVKAPKGVKVIRRKALIATDVVSDGRQALLAAPDLSACGYTDNEALSKHLEDFLNIMAESAE